MKEDYVIQTLAGGKIYRYVNKDGKRGKTHVSRSPITPLPVYMDDNNTTYVVVGGEKVKICSLTDLDSINNALNNYKKSLNFIMQIPSEKIAQGNPDLYLKTLHAIRTAAILAPKTKRNKTKSYEVSFEVAQKEHKIRQHIQKQSTAQDEPEKS